MSPMLCRLKSKEPSGDKEPPPFRWSLWAPRREFEDEVFPDQEEPPPETSDPSFSVAARDVIGRASPKIAEYWDRKVAYHANYMEEPGWLHPDDIDEALRLTLIELLLSIDRRLADIQETLKDSQ